MGSMGGSPKTPEVKGIGQLTSEAVNANISSLPAIIAAMNQYGPEYAAALLKSNYAANPTLKPLGDLINERLDQARGGTIPSYLRDPFTQNLRAAQAARGMAESPISAASEAGQLGALTENANQFSIGAGIDFSKIPGMSMSGSDLQGNLGLDLPTIGQQEGLGQEQNISAINAALDEQSRKKSKFGTIGSLIGGTAGSIIGGPAGAMAGANAGNALGTLF